MDWLVWIGVICSIAGAGLFAFGMRRDPLLAAGVPSGGLVVSGILLFLILSGRSPDSSTLTADPSGTPADQTTGSPPRPSDPEAPPAVKWENALVEQIAPGQNRIDVLARVDPARHQLNGRWTMQNGALITPMTNGTIPAKLTIPVRPPESFQLTAVVERIHGRDSINIGFPVGGRDVMVCIDGYGGFHSGINLIDRSTADRNESGRRGRFIQDGRENTIVYTVGPDSVRVTVNGRTAVDWRGDVNRLSRDGRWPSGPPGQIELASWHTSYRIKKLELKPLP